MARVHREAFRGDSTHDPPEVRLVDELRRGPAWIPALSLVAETSGTVVGHVMCTRAHVGGHHPALGLGPIGVLPAQQRRGIGHALMHAVLGAAEVLEEPLVGVLGDPAYYRRFGFVPGSELGVDPPVAAWGEHFQVRALTPAGRRLRGPFAYAPEFGVD